MVKELIIGFLCFVSLAASAADAPTQRLLSGTGSSTSKVATPRKTLPLILLEVDRQQEAFAQKKKVVPTDKQPPLLANRVYLFHYDLDGVWYFALTNFEGHLLEPYEFLRQDSVLPGKLLGAKKPDQRYELNYQGVWAKTFKKEIQYFWLETRPPFLHIVEFFPMEGKN